MDKIQPIEIKPVEDVAVSNYKYISETDEIEKEVVITKTVRESAVVYENERQNLLDSIELANARIAEIDSILSLKK